MNQEYISQAKNMKPHTQSVLDWEKEFDAEFGDYNKSAADKFILKKQRDYIRQFISKALTTLEKKKDEEIKEAEDKLFTRVLDEKEITLATYKRDLVKWANENAVNAYTKQSSLAMSLKKMISLKDLISHIQS